MTELGEVVLQCEKPGCSHPGQDVTMFTSLHVTLCQKHFREICRDAELDNIFQKVRIARLRLDTWQKALRGGLDNARFPAENVIDEIDHLERSLYEHVRNWVKFPAAGTLPS